jgi:hypothetical protein
LKIISFPVLIRIADLAFMQGEVDKKVDAFANGKDCQCVANGMETYGFYHF